MPTRRARTAPLDETIRIDRVTGIHIGICLPPVAGILVHARWVKSKTVYLSFLPTDLHLDVFYFHDSIIIIVWRIAAVIAAGTFPPK